MSEKLTKQPLQPEGARVKPKVPASRGSCFVIMPFNSHVFDSYYDEAIKPTVEKLGYKCVRVDREPHNDEIILQIRNGIDDSAVVIVDLTDDRPNCYFEAGYAVARGKSIIFQRLDSPPKYQAVFHFDVQPYPFILYGTIADLRKKLRFRLEALRNNT